MKSKASISFCLNCSKPITGQPGYFWCPDCENVPNNFRERLNNTTTIIQYINEIDMLLSKIGCGLSQENIKKIDEIRSETLTRD